MLRRPGKMTYEDGVIHLECADIKREVSQSDHIPDFCLWTGLATYSLTTNMYSTLCAVVDFEVSTTIYEEGVRVPTSYHSTSPEVLLGGDAGPKSDIYAVGPVSRLLSFPGAWPSPDCCMKSCEGVIDISWGLEE